MDSIMGIFATLQLSLKTMITIKYTNNDKIIFILLSIIFNIIIYFLFLIVYYNIIAILSYGKMDSWIND